MDLPQILLPALRPSVRGCVQVVRRLGARSARVSISPLAQICFPTLFFTHCSRGLASVIRFCIVFLWPGWSRLKFYNSSGKTVL
jgi:hypothetical protein